MVQIGTLTTHLRHDKFIISCAARTGSTMLERLLRSHPDILCHGEVMQPGGVGPMYGPMAVLREATDEAGEVLYRYARERPTAFLYDIVFDPRGSLAVGFKFKTDEAFDARFPNINRVQEVIGADADIKVIRLRRRDILAQYISHAVVLRQTGRTYITSTDDRPTAEPFKADPGEVARYCLDVTFREKRADKAYRNHRQLRVDYEELTSGDDAIHARLVEFLGVAPAPLTTTTKRVLPDSRELLINADEVITELELVGFPEGRYPRHLK